MRASSKAGFSVRRSSFRNAPVLSLVCLIAAPSALAGQVAPPDTASSVPAFCCRERHLAPAAAEVFAAQLIPWYFNRYVTVDTTAVLSWRSWRRNLAEGFEWDPNSFITNMFMHPYHGNAYFNIGRTNGYTFYESSALAWAGSMLWEMFGENNRGAINDWVNTSMGGIAIGEALYRSSRALLDNEASGTERTLRELGSFLLNPFGGFNRLVRGEMTRLGPNPADRLPSRLATTLMVGLRSVDDGTEPNSGRDVAYADMTITYGDHLQDRRAPFDAFTLSLQLNGSGTNTVGRLQVDGTLQSKVLRRTDRTLHVLGVDQHYDYLNNETFEVGGQSFGVTLRSLFQFRSGLELRTLVEPVGAVIWAVNTDYDIQTGRDYDFGSGAGLRTRADVRRSGIDVLTVRYTSVYSHTLSGAAGNHVVQLIGLTVRAPIVRRTGLAMDYLLFLRDSFYRDFDDVHQRHPQFRVSLALFP